MANKIYLVLENGKVFEGKSFGAYKELIGEIVFTTAMNGYVETLTDLSFYGQIVVQTYPLIGNYGVMSEDFESKKPVLKAYVVRQYCKEPSNFRCEQTLDEYLKQNDIVGIYDIDTRELTKIIREVGVMNGIITSNIDNIDKLVEATKNFKVVDAVKSVSCSEIQTYKSENNKYKVVLWDFGSKENIKRELLKHNCEVIVVPYNTTAKEIRNIAPDGIMLSNGPGNPKDNPKIIEQLKEVCTYNIPLFGICLGHQLVALSQGADTEKLKYGHRGVNHAVKDVETGKIYTTSQNHGYAVIPESLPKGAEVSFYNVNDRTCEGVKYNNIPVFTVQFHPEAAAGPCDSEFLFDRFIDLMEKTK